MEAISAAHSAERAARGQDAGRAEHAGCCTSGQATLDAAEIQEIYDCISRMEGLKAVALARGDLSDVMVLDEQLLEAFDSLSTKTGGTRDSSTPTRMPTQDGTDVIQTHSSPPGQEHAHRHTQCPEGTSAVGSIGPPYASGVPSSRAIQNERRENMGAMPKKTVYDDTLTSYPVIQQHPENHYARAPSHPLPPPSPSGVKPEDLDVDPEELIPASQIHLGNPIGSGGYGEVWHAKWHAKAVAVKRVRLQGVGANDVANARKELKALRVLRHHRLVQFFGASIDGMHLLLVTELVEGGSLFDRLHRSATPLSALQRQGIALQTVEGIDYLHRQGVVHRDIKPANILLDYPGNVHICDFGLARWLESTQITWHPGTPRYTAPECYMSQAKPTEKNDIWSLGCLLSELFSGQLPYADCETQQQLCYRITVQKLPPQLPLVSVPLYQAVARCVQFDPAVRPSAWELAMQLSSITPGDFGR